MSDLDDERNQFNADSDQQGGATKHFACLISSMTAVKPVNMSITFADG